MRRFSSLAAVVVLAGALVACSSGEPTPAADEETTPTQEASTVEQWASVVAVQQAEWADWQQGWDDATCSSLAASDGAIDCSIMLTTAVFMTQTTKIETSAATTPSAGQFIAEEPPAEVAELWAETTEAAAVAADAGAAWDDAGCGTSSSTDCIGLAFDFGSAIDDLQSSFTAWTPYL